MLVVMLLLTFSGYPLAFVLAGTAVIFALVAIETGLVSLPLFKDLPGQLFNEVLLDPALLALPLLLFFCELLIETGQMARSSLMIKHLFHVPNVEAQNQKKARKKFSDPAPSAKNTGFDRSVFMMIFAPGAVLCLLLARIFDIPVEYLTFALLPVASLLCVLYFANWLLGLWVVSHKQKLKQCHNTDIADNPWVATTFAVSLFRLLPPFLMGIIALVLMLHVRASLFSTLSIVILCLLVLSLCQGKLRLVTLFEVMHRAAITTGAIAAILLAVHAFHLVYFALGGHVRLNEVASWFLSIDNGPTPWLILLLLLFALAFLGLIFDWLILAIVVIPLLMPIFAQMDFNSLLIPIWAVASTHLAANDMSNNLIASDLILQTRLWFAALLWVSLTTALVTFAKQNGEMATKNTCAGNQKDSG